MLITISISSAPFLIASIVSNALVSIVLAPSGNPITVQTKTSLPFNKLAACWTLAGLTQTLLKSYLIASSQSFLISALVAKAFNKVWSINLLTCILFSYFSIKFVNFISS